MRFPTYLSINYRAVFFGILLLNGVGANAQRIKRKETDKFTKAEVIELAQEKLTRGLEYTLRKVNNTYLLDLRVRRLTSFYIPSDGSFYLLLDNEKSIQLTTKEGKVANGWREGTFNIWEAWATYEIPASALADLSSHSVKSARVYFGSGYLDFDNIKEKHAEIFHNAINMIAKSESL